MNAQASGGGTGIGLMTPQIAAQNDFAAADLMIRSNYLGLVSILGEVANRMEQRGSGTIIGVSSVSGDRGRHDRRFGFACHAHRQS